MDTSSTEFSPRPDHTPYSAYQLSSETREQDNIPPDSFYTSHIEESPEKLIASKSEFFTPGLTQLLSATSEEELSPMKAESVKGKAGKANQGIELYNKGLEFLEKKQGNTEKVLKQICPFRPELCSKSVSLLKTSKHARKPLYVPKTPRAGTVEEAAQDFEKESVKKLQPENFQDFIDRNYKRPLQHIKSKRQIVPPCRDEPDVECTFTPRLNQTSMEILSSKGESQTIYERTKNFNEKVQKWKEEQKKEKDQKMIQACTFKPQITRKKLQGSKSTMILTNKSKDFSKGYAFIYKDAAKHENITLN
jgi:hypothetical protein